MPTVQPFNRAVIEAFLQSRDWPYNRDEDGDFWVEFADAEPLGTQATVWFSAGGEDESIYLVRLTTDTRIPRAEWERAKALCNTWNQQRRWAKTYLFVEHPETDTEGMIYTEEQIDLVTGIHSELFEVFTDTVIASGMSLWEWLHASTDW